MELQSSSPPRLLLITTSSSVVETMQRALDGTFEIFVSRRPSRPEVLTHTMPDVVILDEDVAGIHTCARLREVAGDVPILVLAAGGPAKEARRFLSAGATDVFPRQLLGLPTNLGLNPTFPPVRWPKIEALQARESILGRLFSLLHGAAALRGARENTRSLARALRLARLAPWQFESRDGGRFRWSDEVTAEFGIPPSVPNGGVGGLLRWVHADDYTRVAAAMLEPAPHRIEYRFVLPDGRIRTVRQEAEILAGELGLGWRMVGVTQDITELREAEHRIEHLAYFDTITNLPNRAALRRFLDRSVQAATADARPLAVLALDLDGFKRVNDTLGHAAGDYLLREVATRLLGAIQCGSPERLTSVEDYLSGDAIVARLGGDEFVVVLERPEAAAAVAERINEFLAKAFHIGGREVFISSSIGIACFPDDGRDVDELLEHADVALYHAKELGRKNFQFFTASLLDKTRRRVVIENGLRSAHHQRTAADDGLCLPASREAEKVDVAIPNAGRFELSLVYQPKVEIPSCRMIGVEALMRWTSPELGAVSPAEFIPIAEDTGLIVELGEWALREACSQAASFDAGPLSVSVNVSMRQFREPNFVRSVARILEATKLPPSRLEIELTEGVVMRDPASSRRVLEQLKELGVEIALDDFGTGYSSLNYLAQLPIDTLKIDRSFVAAIGRAEKTTMITSAIIGLARGLAIDVVVEGVETQTQLDYLTRYAPLTIQGYVFSKPVPIEQLTSWRVPPRKRTVSGVLRRPLEVNP